MALDAKQLAVIGIVAESFHFLRIACRFDWHDVMAVHASPDDAFLLAFLAQSFARCHTMRFTSHHRFEFSSLWYRLSRLIALSVCQGES
jgi:hypothetical protein